MTKKRLITFLLISSYTVITFFIGCIPEDSLRWSADGSVGIYSKDGALFLVDGSTGSLTPIAPKETTTAWPGLSHDGSYFAYGKIIKVDDFNKALNLLSPVEAETIWIHAELLEQKILAEGVKGDNLPALGTNEEDSFNEQHTKWVNRLLVESADKQLAARIGLELIKKIREKELAYFQLVLAPTTDPSDEKILATGHQQLWHINFSPDAKLISWVADRIFGKTFEVGFDLYVAVCDQKTPPALVASAVAIGCDFRRDSRAIAYIKPEEEDFDNQKFAIGSLVERILIDSNGKFLASPEESDGNDFPAIYTCTGPANELAGVLYYSWMNVSYARDNRIFFSSAKMLLPSTKLDTERGTVFCYDSLTGSVSNILPQIVLDFTQGNFHLFALSQDSRKILLPENKNTLGVYALGSGAKPSKVLIDADEGFGDDAPPKIAAQWKGQARISCLVSEKSHFLTDDPDVPHRRKEIVILDTDGKLVQILSRDWPDELLDY